MLVLYLVCPNIIPLFIAILKLKNYLRTFFFNFQLILASVLNALYDAVSQMLKKNVEKRFLMDHLDAVYLAIDELVDGGVILEADSNSIVQRVAMKVIKQGLCYFY